MPSRAGTTRRTALSVLLLAFGAVPTARAAGRDLGYDAEARAWVGSFHRYAAGESNAAELSRRSHKELEGMLRALFPLHACDEEACREAGALLHTEAAFVAEEEGRSGDAHFLLDVGRVLLDLREDQGTPKTQVEVSAAYAAFRHDWLVAAGRYELGRVHLVPARSFLEQAVALAPRNPDALTALGTVHDLAGTVEGLLEPPPEQRQPLLWVRSERARARERARDRYREALVSNPAWSEARLRLARRLQEDGDAEAAASELTRVALTATDPTLQALAHLFLGQVRESANATEAALAEYRRAIELSPRSQAMRLAASALLQARGEDREAEHILAALWDASIEGADPWLAYRLGFPGFVPAQIEALRRQVRR